MSSDATDNTMRAELLPCPFCGGECSVSKHEYGYWRGWCDPCEMEGPPADKEAEATAAWNRRTDTARWVADITGAEVGAVIQAHMRARDAGNTPGTSNWAIAILRALRAMPPIDNSAFSKPDRAPSEDGFPYG